MADIILPSTRPTGDDQKWKREVEATLAQLKAELAATQSQIGRR